MTKHARGLTPSDIADRCRALGATVVSGKGADGTRLQVRSPVRGSETVLMSGTVWRSHADQSDVISHLKRVGLDVLNDPMFTVPKRPTPADVAKRTNGHAPAAESPSPGTGRPTLTYSGPAESVTAQDDSGPTETQRADDGPDGPIDVWEYVESLEEQIATLTVRVDGLVEQVAGLTRRAVGGYRPETDAERLIREMAEDVRTAFAGLPVGLALPRATIAEMIGLDLSETADPTSVLGHRLSHVLRALRDSGEMTQHGSKSMTRWSRTGQTEQNGDDDDRQ